VSTSSTFSSYVSGYQNLDVGNAVNLSVSGLSAGTTYYYQVRAYNSDGTSGNSSTSTVTTTASNGRTLLVVSTTASSGSQFTLPIQLVSKGDENALGFSLAFNPNVVTFVGVSNGSSAGTATLIVNSNQVSTGNLGLAMALPFGQTFTLGTQQVVRITFQAATTAVPTNTPLTFGDTPIQRDVSDVAANDLPASYADGQISISIGYEGDVAPRPNGDGKVTIIDWVQEGRFVAGVDTVNNGSEFQRADCAPRSTLGDGRITITDWVQAGRYAAGLDPLTASGGPTSPSTQIVIAKMAQPRDSTNARVVSFESGAITPGQTNAVTVQLEAQGNENALGFSLQFDSTNLTFDGVRAGSSLTGGTLIMNTNQVATGQLGIALGLPQNNIDCFLGQM
jgi:hypothetical protein